MAASSDRELARRVATLLVEKGRTDDAVVVLSAWAASGANDREGQALLAEALRLAPGHAIARAAFEQMEGVGGEHAELAAAIERWSSSALLQTEAENKRPVFHRAQVGFNNNVRYKGALFHVQTEDSGLDRPHVLTHLFADGGRVVKSTKRTYASEVARADVAPYVRGLMKAQHMEMCIALREGTYDEVIAGRATGGMSVLEGYPEVKLRRGAGDQPAAASVRPPPPAPAAAEQQAAPPPQAHYRLVMMRSLWGGPERYEPTGDEVVLGHAGDVPLEGERFVAPREAVLQWRSGSLFLVDLDGGNGVFMRVRAPVELASGDEFMVGDQILRLGDNPTPDDEPGEGPTYFYSSPRWISSFRLTQIWEGGAEGAVVVAKGSTAQIGRAVGDIVFAADPLVADQHCIVEEQAGSIVLSDLGTRAGTFVRVTGERELVHGDEIAVGRTRLRVEMI